MNSVELQNITMSTGGAYSLATRGAEDVINAAIPMVEEALLKMELEEKRNFSFADMGCADGGTSLQMINQLITTLRGKKPKIEVLFTRDADSALPRAACLQHKQSRALLPRPRPPTVTICLTVTCRLHM